MIKTGKEAVGYMEELLEDLLLSTKLEFSEVRLDLESISMEELIRQSVERFIFQIEEKKIQVQVDAPFKVRADRKNLMKVFMNLIGNAVNYIGDGKNPQIIVRCIQLENEFEFSVNDTGIGIPEKDQVQVFQKFRRGSNTGGINGTGLGLSIVRAAVEAHNGRVWVVSEQGKGTTFYFTIPVDTGAAKG